MDPEIYGKIEKDTTDFRMTVMYFHSYSKNREGRKKVINASTMLVTALTNTMTPHPNGRTIRRHEKNTGWWDLVWSTYDQHRFKETFGVTRTTFMYILPKYSTCP